MSTQLSPAPSRRALVRGAAWTVPVVAVAAAAPAYAASCGVAPLRTMDLTTKTGTDGTMLTVTSQATGMTLGSNNLSTTDSAGPANGWLKFENEPRNNGNNDNPPTAGPPLRYQSITLTFSSPVYNLNFEIRDLDTSGGTTGFFNPQRYYNFWDAVAIQSAAAFSATRGSDLTGSGSLADPWRQGTFTNSDSGTNDLDHRVLVNFVGPVTSLTFSFWTVRGRAAYTGVHSVWIGNMEYKSNCIL